MPSNLKNKSQNADDLKELHSDHKEKASLKVALKIITEGCSMSCPTKGSSIASKQYRKLSNSQ